MQLFLRVRQKMEQGDAEHESGHEADGHLQPRVGEMDGQQQPAARQRRKQDQRAVNDQQPPGVSAAMMLIANRLQYITEANRRKI